MLALNTEEGAGARERGRLGKLEEERKHILPQSLQEHRLVSKLDFTLRGAHLGL